MPQLFVLTSYSVKKIAFSNFTQAFNNLYATPSILRPHPQVLSSTRKCFELSYATKTWLALTCSHMTLYILYLIHTPPPCRSLQYQQRPLPNF